MDMYDKRKVRVMIFPENRKLFTSRETAKACGISRSTLLRMEEDGFLTPYRIDPDSGYRYYDMQNIAAVGQYQRLQTIGLSRKEITDLYYERVDSEEFMEQLQQKIDSLERFLNEYKLRHGQSENYSFFYTNLPAVTCYCRDITAHSIEEFETACYLIHQESVEAGCQLLGSKPLFTVLENPDEWTYPDDSTIRMKVCVPVSPDTKPDPNIQSFPAVRAFTLLGYGDYSVGVKLMDLLLKEAGARGLEAAGPIRHIALVARYTGAHYDASDYCYACTLPVRSEPYRYPDQRP